MAAKAMTRSVPSRWAEFCWMGAEGALFVDRSTMAVNAPWSLKREKVEAEERSVEHHFGRSYPQCIERAKKKNQVL